MDFPSTIKIILTPLGPDGIRSPVTLGLAGFLATCISYLAYLSYSPRIDKAAPEFTSDTVPLVGSWRFFTQKW
jgi:sterol 14-demethylase